MKFLTCLIFFCLASISFARNVGDFPGGGIVSVSPTVPTWILPNNANTVARFVHVRTNSPSSILTIKVPQMMTATNTYSVSVRGSVTNIFTNTSSWVTYTNLLIRAAAGQVVTGANIFTMGPGDVWTYDAQSIWNGGMLGLAIDGTNAVVETGDDR